MNYVANPFVCSLTVITATFYNAAGVSLSQSSCTMTATVAGTL